MILEITLDNTLPINVHTIKGYLKTDEKKIPSNNINIKLAKINKFKKSYLIYS